MVWLGGNFCLIACKVDTVTSFSSYQIPKSAEGKDWFYYVEPTATHELLQHLTAEFLAVMDKCPSRLKRKITTSAGSGGLSSAAHSPNPQDSTAAQRKAAELKHEFDLEVNNASLSKTIKSESKQDVKQEVKSEVKSEF